MVVLTHGWTDLRVLTLICRSTLAGLACTCRAGIVATS